MMFNIFLLLLAAGFSGFAISRLGQALGIPFPITVFLAALFGYLLAGIIQA